MSEAEVTGLVDYGNAANYLTVPQIYLGANPLLRGALQLEHIKPRSLGRLSFDANTLSFP